MKVDSATNGKYRIVAEINMIPFIDITLVLLIIFMVMTPALIRKEIKLNLPKAGKADPSPDDKRAVTVQVDQSGALFLEGKRIDEAGLIPALRSRMTSPDTQPLRVEADRDVSFQHVVVVLNAGKAIGAMKMNVSVKADKSR